MSSISNIIVGWTPTFSLHWRLPPRHLTSWPLLRLLGPIWPVCSCKVSDPTRPDLRDGSCIVQLWSRPGDPRPIPRAETEIKTRSSPVNTQSQSYFFKDQRLLRLTGWQQHIFCITLTLVNHNKLCAWRHNMLPPPPCKLTISSHLFARWHLFRHVGYLRYQQQVDLWSSDLQSGVRVTCDVGYRSANFSLPRPLSSRVRPDVRDRQMSDKSIA